MTTELLGFTLAHPIMPAAGPPVRDGAALLACAAGGASALVTKTISVHPAEVPAPNMADFKTYFLNTELWSELPAEQWLETEYPQTRQAGLPVIISLGYTAGDIANLAPRVAPFADALELSTHYIGNDYGPMQAAIQAARVAGVPVLVKMSPFREPQGAALAAQEAGADAIVAVNSFGPAFGIDIEHGGRLWMGGKGYGWMSGPALKPIALRMVYDIARVVDIPVIGVGGISTGEDVVEFLMAGATAVQVCTAAIVKGPDIFGKLAQQLDRWLDKHDYDSVTQIQGLALKQPIPAMAQPPVLLIDRCTGCNRCVTSCVYHALYLEDRKIHIHEERCAQCGLCISRCPVDALHPPA
ncbi:MAG: 4Fe-4S binding protein [Anaerolineae bacterium]|nr:4Fe-4S binding protein [Anaerolineae bacterium]